MKKNDVIKVNITDLNSEGAGVGRYEGLVVFVPYALPSELCEVLIIKLTKSYAVGKLLNVIEPSIDRVEPACPYFYRCGGCDYQHINYEKQLELKVNSTIKNICKISGLNLDVKEVVKNDNIYNYRNKAQFPVALDKNGNITMGFFSSKSHRVIDINNCILQENECNSVIPVIKELAVKHNISIYDEVEHRGILRHVVVRNSSSGLMLILVTNSLKKLENSFISSITNALPSIKTVIQNINTEKGNIILGNKCITLYGDGYIKNELCKITFNLRPLAFLQVNTRQSEKLYEKAIELAQLSGNETVFDAYCGIGIMSLMLAKKAQKVIGVEIVPEAIETAKETAKTNNINNAEFYVGSCEEVLPSLLDKGNTPDVLVVDPPRAGCDDKLLHAISNADIKKIVYVSCNPATLARDIKTLCDLGYKCSDVTFVDMFSHTKHIESVVSLER